MGKHKLNSLLQDIPNYMQLLSSDYKSNINSEYGSLKELYISLGKDITDIIATVYIHNNYYQKSKDDILCLSKYIKRELIHCIYNKFKLDFYINPKKKDSSSEREKIVYNVSGMLFKSKGFLYTYNLIYDLILDSDFHKSSPVLEYAKEIAALPSYCFTYNESEQTYTCNLTVGCVSINFTSDNQTEAINTVNQLFTMVSKRNNKKIPANPAYELSAQRESEISNIFHLSKKFHIQLSAHETDEILTDRDYFFAHYDNRIYHNDIMEILGTLFINSLRTYYILNNFNNLNCICVLSIDDTEKQLCNLFVNITSKIYLSDTAITKKEFRIIRHDFVMPRFFARTLINIISSNNDEAIADIEKVIEKYITNKGKTKTSSKKAVSVTKEDNTSNQYNYKANQQHLLNKLFREHHLHYSMECKRESNYLYKATIKASIRGSKLKTEVCSAIQAQAIEKACGKMLSKARNTLAALNSEMYLPPSNSNVLYNNNKGSSASSGSLNNVNFLNRNNILYICKGTVSCRERNHNIVCATGLLKNLSEKTITINVNYCQNCRIYFISYNEYQHYQEKYGSVIGNFHIRSNNSCGCYFDDMSSESLLHLCGYNVNQNANLSSGQRRYILSLIIDNHVMEKYQIIEYLNRFISSRRYQPNMKLACSKWKSDLEWVRSYKINEQKTVEINKIKKYR